MDSLWSMLTSSTVRLKTAFLVWTLIIAFSAAGAQAQASNRDRWQSIVGDPNYLWGEAVGETREKARQAAQADLLSRINISILVNYESSTVETQRNGSLELTDSTRNEVSAFTGHQLKGLNHIVLKEGGTYRALAYICRSDYQRSLDHRKQQIRDYLRMAQVAEEECRIGDALKNLYWAWLMCKTCPDTVMVRLGDSTYSSPTAVLPEKIRQIASSVVARDRGLYEARDVILAELEFTYRGCPIRNLQFNYYSGLATDYGKVENGRAVIPIYDKPVDSIRQLVLTIDHAAEKEMLANDELYRLHELVGSDAISSSIATALLTFPWLQQQSQRPQPEPPAVSRSGVEDSASDTVIPRVIVDLSNLRDTPDFLRVLEQYRILGELTFSKQPSDVDSSREFVAIVDENHVTALFEYDGTRYRHVTNNQTVDDLKSEYSGKREVWIHIPRAEQ